MTLLESISDPNLTIGLSFAGLRELVQQWRHRRNSAVVAERHRPGGPAPSPRLAGLGTPLAVATAFLQPGPLVAGTPGWRTDVDDAPAMSSNGESKPAAGDLADVRNGGRRFGVFRVDDAMLHDGRDGADR